jgi:hypothetical protein
MDVQFIFMKTLPRQNDGRHITLTRNSNFVEQVHDRHTFTEEEFDFPF